MDIGLNNSYDISSSYSIKLNDKEMLVYENNDEIRSEHQKELKLKDDEDKKAKEDSQSSSIEKLSESEKQMVLKLQSRDTEVRAHESAHQSGGASTGAASFTYQQGPDGKMYAIGGEVPISFQSGSTPEETIANAQAVIASALAPADPSGQDMAVASSAMVMMVKAQQQKAKETQDEITGKEVYSNEVDNSNKDEVSGIDIPA